MSSEERIDERPMRVRTTEQYSYCDTDVTKHWVGTNAKRSGSFVPSQIKR